MSLTDPRRQRRRRDHRVPEVRAVADDRGLGPVVDDIPPDPRPVVEGPCMGATGYGVREKTNNESKRCDSAVDQISNGNPGVVPASRRRRNSHERRRDQCRDPCSSRFARDQCGSADGDQQQAARPLCREPEDESQSRVEPERVRVVEDARKLMLHDRRDEAGGVLGMKAASGWTRASKRLAALTRIVVQASSVIDCS